MTGRGFGKCDFWKTLSCLYDKNIVSFKVLAPSRSSDASNFVLPPTLQVLSLGSGYSTVGLFAVDNFPENIVSSEGSCLSSLFICSTNLCDLSFLNDLSSLVSVQLNYNLFTSFDSVRSALPNVTTLDLSYNNLNSLYGIQYFTGLQTLNISYNITLGDTASYNGGDSFNNLGLLTDLYNTNKTLTSVNLTGCTSITADSTNSYWTALKAISGLTVTGP